MRRTAVWARPRTLAEAMRLLGGNADGAWRIIAGGTDLMVEQRLHPVADERNWLDLTAVSELSGLYASDGGLRIGACVPLRRIARDRRVRESYPLLAATAAVTGALPIQNRATLGGNVANASPAADNPPALLVYDALIELAGPQGRRRLPYREFHTGYKQTRMRADELIVALHLPAPKPGPAIEFHRKVGTRQAQAIAKLSLAARLRLDAAGAVHSARFGLASVGPAPAALPAVEDWLVGQRPEAVDTATLRRHLAQDIRPLDDIRSTAAYRLEVAARLLLTALRTPPGAPSV
ncbi:hypothetical protein BJI67_02635 [Acidihalobacter aeolianus]|uniref:FAD-binding PCMH-type domain-containing protein n=1 Tax=Acidihalobacter aeolianus TaxID=2792603 RepID=A0A1D8K576_9GAMM|nr:FAD binding domain-containing protein [Acidihalobacter aeolianus]AOV16109.1 hypothetical protein BJI67_02635 [Acidihalobacter aeolianus]